MTQLSDLTIDDMKLMWVVGAAERLATLGIIGGEIPLRVTPDGIDTYLQIDEKRNMLFESDIEVAMIFEVIAKSQSEEEIDKEDMDDMIDLLLEYKNNRTQLVKYALSYAET